MTQFETVHVPGHGASAYRGAAAELKARLGEVSWAGVFSPPGYSLGEMVGVVEAELGGPVAGTTTAGQFTHRGRTDGAVIFGYRNDDAKVASALLPGKDISSVAATYQADFSDLRHTTAFSLVDGLSGNGEDFVAALRAEMRPHHQIVGGAAGDDGAFEVTRVALGSRTTTSGASVILQGGNEPIGIGLGHGLEPGGPRRRVTKASANVIHEIDNKPAFETYRAFARERGVELTHENAGRFMIEHEVGVYFFDELRHARAPLGVDANGAITLAARVKEGSAICLLDGEENKMISAARDAALEAKENLRGAKPAGVLVFDCICRGMMLGDSFDREIEAVRSVFGSDIPIAGFLTYGEIARYRGKLQGWHNTAAVVAALPA